MDDHNDDGAEAEEEKMCTMKRLVTEVVVELIEKIWNWFTGDTKRLS